jgi:hypothetical protein
MYKKHIWTWAPSLPRFADRFFSSQYISTSLSEGGQSSFCALSWSDYISIQNCMGNCFRKHMVLDYVSIRMKWHYFIIDLNCSSYLLQHETLRSWINIRIRCVFCKFIICFLGRKFQLIVFACFIVYDILFSYFIIMGVFLQLFYNFSHIILSLLNLETWVCFKIMRFVIVLQLFYWFSYIVKCNFNLVSKSIFQMLEWFLSFITPQKVIINGKPSIIACSTWFITH